MSRRHRLCFLPHDYAWRKTRGRNNVFCAVLFIAVLLASGTVATWNQQSLESLQAEQAAVHDEVDHAAARLNQLSQIQQRQQRLETAAAQTADRFTGVPRSFVLSEICNATVDGVVLTDLSLSADHDHTTVQITGTADTASQVAQYVGALSRSAVLRDVNSVSDEAIDGHTPGAEKIRKFVLRMSVDNAASVALGAPCTTVASVDLVVPR